MNIIAKKFLDGELLLIDKPLEWTSFDVVKKIRNTISRQTGLKKIKVGHAGTLDPLATGLLIVCTGKYTKRIHEFQNQEKEYTGTFFIGATTPSFDKETEIDHTFETNHITDKLLLETKDSFTGELDQIPPIYSAINIQGVRAYTHARNLEEITLSARKILIKSFELTKIELPQVQFKVVCSKGTYVRSLARDFGKELNSGAYLIELLRSRIGNYHLCDALTIEGFEKYIDKLCQDTG
ncbi:MAG: tRNA pseudouridine(55) synthase TruB [Bacteroidales bacterium]|nr:tRNA pseudouridine(55) synthase TruB [Bacteroidales bacterium]